MSPDLSTERKTRLNAYLRELRRRFESLTVQAQGSGADLPAIPLEGIYIWTQFSTSPIRVEADQRSWPETQDIFKALPDHPVVAVIGDPGSGKSTFVNFLVQQLARQTQNPTRDALGGKIPIPFVIRELDLEGVRDWATLLRAFYRWPGAAALQDGVGPDRAVREGKAPENENSDGLPGDDLNIVDMILRNGNGYVVVDGFDEAPGARMREILSHALLEAQAYYVHRDNRWLVTSRPVGYEEAPFLYLRFRGFDGEENAGPFPLGPLENDEHSSSIKRIAQGPTEPKRKRPRSNQPALVDGIEFDPTSPNLIARARSHGWHEGTPEAVGEAAPCLYVAPFRDEEVARFAAGWFGARSKGPQEAKRDQAQFLEKIGSQDSLREMARLPQLLGLMCLVYLIDRSLPDGRADLFKRVTAVYLEQIPAQVGSSVRYPLKQAEGWLARVGFEMQRLRALASSSVEVEVEVEVEEEEEEERPSAAVVSRDTIQGWIANEQERLGHDPAAAEDFLHFVSTRGGLFLERGEGQLAFLHLAFQEYFAALFIHDTLRWDIPQASGRRARYSVAEAEPPVTKEEMLAAAARIEWQESFVLLFELYSERDVTSALESLMDEAEARLEKADVAPLVQMLGRIVLDSTVQLAKVVRYDTAVELLAWEGKFQTRNPASRRFAFRSSLLGNPLPLLAWAHENLGPDHLQRVSAAFWVLDLGATQVADLSPLAGLGSLTRLNLIGTQVADLSPLAGLASLTRLNLDGTQVADLSPLAGLASLTELYLGGTQVADLSPLAGLASLTELYLVGTQVADLSPLAGLGSLTGLSFGGTQVADLSPLAGLGSLTGLSLDGTRVTDLSPLAGLGSLTRLNLDGTEVADLSPLAGLASLTRLNLIGTQVADLSPLAGLGSLTELYLGGTQVADLSPLAGLGSLTELYLVGTQVADLSPLTGLGSLTRLYLHRTRVADLSPLTGLATLTELSLIGTEVADLSPLAGLGSLTELIVDRSATSMASVEELKRALPKLRVYWVA
jgi:internalin A